MREIILIDLNGTLIAPGADVEFSPALVKKFSEVVARLREREVRVGLSSDTPTVPLIHVAMQLGLGKGTPILGENGNTYSPSLNGSMTVLRQFSDANRSRIETAVRRIGTASGLVEVRNVVAAEFGKFFDGVENRRGQTINHAHEWGFGAYRHGSISVFGPADFLQSVYERVQGLRLSNGAAHSCDLSRHSHYLGIHPIADFREGKRTAIAEMLAKSYDHRIKSMYDWVGPLPKKVSMIGDDDTDYLGEGIHVASAFVGGAEISDETQSGAVHVSDKFTLEGVVDCLGVLDRHIEQWQGEEITQLSEPSYARIIERTPARPASSAT